VECKAVVALRQVRHVGELNVAVFKLLAAFRVSLPSMREAEDFAVLCLVPGRDWVLTAFGHLGLGPRRS
jgi:hypothetical protein